MKYLTVHSRPEHVDIDVGEDKDNITINCSCYCVHPSESISMKIEILNKEKSLSRPLFPLRSTNVTKHICDNTEKSVNGSIKLQKIKWPGNYVDINCLCKEKKLDNERKSHKRYTFSGVPKKPHNVTVHSKTSNSAIISWKKTINGESRQTFVILYKDQSTNMTLNKTLEEESNRESYNMTMDNLKPKTTYQVQILAYNENGKSSLTPPVIFTTLQTENDNSLVEIISIAVSVSIFIVIVTGKKVLSYSSKMNIENTKALIKRISKETPFVKTKPFKDGKDLLDQKGILIYRGIKGDGRLTNAVFLMKHFMEENEYHPAIIHNITKWDEIVNVNVKMILFIPDIIKKATGAELREDVYLYWEKILSCVQYGKIKIIMKCDTHILDNLWFILREIDIFHESCHIDMCKVQLTEEEKRMILKAHCEKNSIDISTDSDRENQNNGSNLPNLKLVINETVISEIARIELPVEHVAMGFPLTCALFCKDRTYTALGKSFFVRPSKYLVDQIDGLKIHENKKKRDQYKILKTLWFTHERNYDKTEVAKYAIDDLLDTYIEKTEDDKYMLKYETIYIAVGLSIAKEEPESVIKHCNWNFFRYHMKTFDPNHQNNRDDAVFYIKEKFRDVVTERCLVELSPDTIYKFFEYVLKCWPGFFTNILNAIENEEEDIKKKHINIIQSSCETVDEKGIFVLACMYDNILAIQELKRRFKIPKNVLEYCKSIASENPDVLAALGHS